MNDLARWPTSEVVAWLQAQNFCPETVEAFQQHNITGETLPLLTDELLAELRPDVSERIRLKLAINKLVQQQGYIDSHSYDVLVALVSEVLRKPGSTPLAQSPTTPVVAHSTVTGGASTATAGASTSTVTGGANTSKRSSLKPISEPLKQLRASTEDPTSKVLQAAMKRHRLVDADWHNFALVICYGDKERILENDEKPVQIFKELKENGKHPAIMLRQKSFTVDVSSTPGGKL